MTKGLQNNRSTSPQLAQPQLPNQINTLTFITLYLLMCRPPKRQAKVILPPALAIRQPQTPTLLKYATYARTQGAFNRSKKANLHVPTP